jgi:NADH:ubiquinone oxidoreductase subunit 6 (subunit J)
MSCLFINFYLLITLIVFIFDKKVFSIYNHGLALGPIVKGVSIVLFIIFLPLFKSHNINKISKIRRAYKEAENIERKYVIAYAALSFMMLPALIFLTILGQRP